ncbi:HD domain-containing protein [Desulfurobacterium crinifex]
MGLNIRDPIHGFIQLNDLEAKIIQTFPFQRLRFIHQLGTTSWVYPSGIHTRFEHSLGVLLLSSRIIERLKLLKSLDISEMDEKVFRLAALLHDIGHAPFSHVGEDMGLFREGIDHELMGKKIIEETEIAELIKNDLGEEAIERIVFIITGKGKPSSSLDNLFAVLLTGQAGIDRMDYLLRDSYFLGVMYGRFDLERILETLCYDDERNLYWEEGGIHALEQFLLARYFMFTEVYYHKNRRIFDFHLSLLIKEYLQSKGLEHFPEDVDKYLRFNDYHLISWAFISNSHFERVFLKRGFFRKIDIESSDHPSPQEEVLWNWLESELKKNFNETDFYFDRADKSPYKFEKSDIGVLLNGELKLLHDVSKLIESLKPIKKRRIYSSSEKREEISQYVKEFLDRERRRIQ